MFALHSQYYMTYQSEFSVQFKSKSLSNLFPVNIKKLQISRFFCTGDFQKRNVTYGRGFP